jgi:hypothetical protein
MLIAIISDIHDNRANLKKCLDWCRTNKIGKILCGGDLTTLETADYLATNFLGEIFVVSGNAEIYHEAELVKYKNINYCGEIGIREIAGVNIGLCHEESQINKVLDVTPLPLDFIFYGHSHKPWLSKRTDITVVNPGNIAGVFHQATFATLDTGSKKLELKILAEL